MSHNTNRLMTCIVCGDKGIGFNYSAITCESCKSFFRRTALHFDKTKCMFGDKCKINALTRKFCPKCRITKCFAVGMEKERILNKEELEVRRSIIKENQKQKTNINKVSNNCYSTSSSSKELTHINIRDNRSESQNTTKQLNIIDKRNIFYKNSIKYCSENSPILRPITDYNNNFNELEGIKLTELLNATLVFKTPDFRITSESVNYSDAIQLMTNKTDEEIRKAVKLSKSLNAFSTLVENDQVNLLKFGVIQILWMIAVDIYDGESDTLTIPLGDKSSATLLKLELLKDSKPDLYECHKRFLQNMVREYDSDMNILFLLLAIVLFDPKRPNLLYRDVIKLQRLVYIHLLQRYLQLKYRSESEAKTRLLSLMNALRDLNVLNQTYIDLYSEERPQNFSPLLEEIYEIRISNNEQ